MQLRGSQLIDTLRLDLCVLLLGVVDVSTCDSMCTQLMYNIALTSSCTSFSKLPEQKQSGAPRDTAAFDLRCLEEKEKPKHYAPLCFWQPYDDVIPDK